jgi:hypothetical protein
MNTNGDAESIQILPSVLSGFRAAQSLVSCVVVK